MDHKVFAVLFICVLLAGLPSTTYSFQQEKEQENVLHPLIVRAANRYQVEIELVKAMIMAESGYDSDAVSQKGARGLMQLMPATAEALGVANPVDPEQNVNAAVRYFLGLKRQFNGDTILALAAYHAGPARVKRSGGITLTSTRRYVIRVLRLYQDYKKGEELDLSPR